MKIILEMSDVIKLLNGQEVQATGPMLTQPMTLKMNKEDTSISASGAAERIQTEWGFALKETPQTKGVSA